MAFSTNNLRKIIVDNLLYQNHYEIELEQLTILHGYNGSGKTTLLTIINSLLNKDYSKTLVCKFNSVSFVFEKGNKIVFTKKSEKLIKCQILDYKQKRIQNSKLTKKVESLGRISPSISPTKLRTIFNSLPNLFSRDNDANFPYIEKFSNNLIDREDAIEYLRNYKFLDFDPPIDKYISDIKSYFIQTNRLETIESMIGFSSKVLNKEAIPYETIRESDGYFVRTRTGRRRSRRESPMLFIQNDLKTRIYIATEHSAIIGREFDSRFFDLLIDEVKSKKVIKFKKKLNLLEDELKNIDKGEEELSRLGLYEGPATETQRAKKVLEEDDDTIIKLINAAKVFSQGLQKKFQVYDDLRNKTAKFSEFLASHLIGKTLKVSKEKGLFFVMHDDIEIAPEDLSSGEKHVVLLAYFLIFLAPKGSIVLIDEPEISLHLEWQETFLDDILKISEESQLRFLIATHSPVIISHYREQMFKLEIPPQ